MLVSHASFSSQMALFPLVRLFHVNDEARKLVLRLKFHISVSVRSIRLKILVENYSLPVTD